MFANLYKYFWDKFHFSKCLEPVWNLPNLSPLSLCPGENIRKKRRSKEAPTAHLAHLRSPPSPPSPTSCTTRIAAEPHTPPNDGMADGMHPCPIRRPLLCCNPSPRPLLHIPLHRCRHSPSSLSSASSLLLLCVVACKHGAASLPSSSLRFFPQAACRPWSPPSLQDRSVLAHVRSGSASTKRSPSLEWLQSPATSMAAAQKLIHPFLCFL
jgi:hypothetical protein